MKAAKGALWKISGEEAHQKVVEDTIRSGT